VPTRNDTLEVMDEGTSAQVPTPECEPGAQGEAKVKHLQGDDGSFRSTAIRVTTVAVTYDTAPHAAVITAGGNLTYRSLWLACAKDLQLASLLTASSTGTQFVRGPCAPSVLRQYLEEAQVWVPSRGQGW
jgi:hypothetical protein